MEKVLSDMIKENIVFFREFISEFKYTGTMFPTSKWAARAMVVPLRGRKERSPLNILELGPGTGSVTVRILENMGDRDTLSVCEINPRFMEALRDSLADNPHYLRHRDRISFYTCPVQEMPEDQNYDVIVCALPFLNFDLGTVEEIFAKLKRMSNEETVMTYYEYIGLRKAGLMMSSPKRKERLQQIDSFFDGVFESHLKGRKKVWANLLPINVYMLKNLDSIRVASNG